MTQSETMERIGHAMQLAWSRIKKSQARMWGDWMTIGEGLLEGRRWAMRTAGTNKPEGRGYVVAYAEWLKRYKVDDMDKSDRAKLLQLMEERPAVEEWRSTLTDYERRNLNNPVIAWRKWTAATRVTQPKPRTAGVSATEHGRAQAMVEEMQTRVEELEQELEAKNAESARGDLTLVEFFKNKGPGEIADCMIASLRRDQLESLSEALAEVIANERHLAFYRERGGEPKRRAKAKPRAQPGAEATE
jgi:Tfp pilus assembly protein FimV